MTNNLASRIQALFDSSVDPDILDIINDMADEKYTLIEEIRKLYNKIDEMETEILDLKVSTTSGSLTDMCKIVLDRAQKERS